MSPQTKKALELFAAKANWHESSLGQDAERFFDFVISAYLNGDHNISLEEFLAVVNAKSSKKPDELSSLSAETAKKRELAVKMFMFSKYEVGIRLLRKFEGTSN